jgi:hypothetical protein
MPAVPGASVNCNSPAFRNRFPNEGRARADRRRPERRPAVREHPARGVRRRVCCGSKAGVHAGAAAYEAQQIRRCRLEPSSAGCGSYLANILLVAITCSCQSRAHTLTSPSKFSGNSAADHGREVCPLPVEPGFGLSADARAGSVRNSGSTLTKHGASVGAI